MKDILAIIALLLIPCVSFALPAFPGAEGSGADTVGGRGGTVYIVDSLSNSGAGTFRDAVSSGNRIIVFNVSGWITLSSLVTISASNITIAGETSPGGIGIRDGSVRITGSDIIITHMRFAGSVYDTDALSIWGNSGATDIIIDHCSLRWGCDETAETAYNPLNITFSWNIIGPGVTGCAPESNHNLGFLVWGGNDTRITFHHNYFPHNRYRNPEINGGGGSQSPRLSGSNNVGFDTYGGYTGLHSYTGMEVNWMHNYFKKASQNNNDAREGIIFGGASSGGDNGFYIYGNMGAWRDAWDQSDTGYDHWDSTKTEWNGATPHVSWKKDSAWAMPGIAVTVTNMTSAYATTVVEGAGAQVPVQDSVDATLVSDYANTTQNFYSTGERSYPSLSGAAWTDSDSDGVDDSWEATHGMTVGSADATDDNDSDGYDNIEEWFHDLVGIYNGGMDSNPAKVSGIRVQ